MSLRQLFTAIEQDEWVDIPQGFVHHHSGHQSTINGAPL